MKNGPKSLTYHLNMKYDLWISLMAGIESQRVDAAEHQDLYLNPLINNIYLRVCVFLQCLEGRI